MANRQTTTKKMTGLRVVDAKRGKRIGKVHRFVFHPSERRAVGFTVKRPDAALMFHRKDLFVSLGGYELVDGQVVVSERPDATDKGAIKALGLDWDACVIWVGMPVLTVSGDVLGFVDDVAFDAETGAVESLSTEKGIASDALLGKLVVPGRLVKGFRRGRGAPLAPAGEHRGGEGLDEAESGAILVADEAAEISAEGGVAAAAGKASAVVADKAKKGAGKARVVVDDKVQKAKPTARKVAQTTGAAVEAGAYAAGKQLGRASGMFAAFKEEFDKAARGEGE